MFLVVHEETKTYSRRSWFLWPLFWFYLKVKAELMEFFVTFPRYFLWVINETISGLACNNKRTIVDHEQIHSLRNHNMA